jgi:hypothetical protein
VQIDRTTTFRQARRVAAAAALAISAGALLAGCASWPWPQEPTYTDAELKAICERQGGWWRGNLIPGYCEYQSASLQSP